MERLKRIDRIDVEKLRRYLENYNGYLMDFSIPNIFSLQGRTEIFVAELGKNLVVFRRGRGYYDVVIPPLFDLENTILKVGEKLKSLNGGVFGKISNIDSNMIKYYENYPGYCREESGDYIYLIDDFLNLSGSQNRHKRNGINCFEKNYPQYSLTSITQNDIKKCVNFP